MKRTKRRRSPPSRASLGPHPVNPATMRIFRRFCRKYDRVLRALGEERDRLSDVEHDAAAAPKSGK